MSTCPECGIKTNDIDRFSGLCYACDREATIAEEEGERIKPRLPRCESCGMLLQEEPCELCTNN